MATWIGSTNKTAGRRGYRPEAIVVHIMDDEHIANVDAWFNTPKPPGGESPVSAHYGIAKTGAVHQYVQEMDTAWHAGRVNKPAWTMIKPGVNPNLYTIGIEHEGKPGDVWPDAMMESSSSLIAEVSQRWAIPLDRDHVIGHREIYSLKPYCPGPDSLLEDLVVMAHSVVVSGTGHNLVTGAGTTSARTALNVRLGAASSQAELVRSVPPGAVLPYVGWTSNGESVHGNAHWYVDGGGNWFWAGATVDPVPG